MQVENRQDFLPAPERVHRINTRRDQGYRSYNEGNRKTINIMKNYLKQLKKTIQTMRFSLAELERDYEILSKDLPEKNQEKENRVNKHRKQLYQ